MTSAERKFTSNIDGQSAGFGSLKGDSQNPVYGLGFAWHINQMYSIRGEFQQLDGIGQASRTGQEDLTVIGLGSSPLLMRAGHFLLVILIAACSGTDVSSAHPAGGVRIGNAFVATPVAKFNEPWAMTFLPDGRLLVTEKKGALKVST